MANRGMYRKIRWATGLLMLIVVVGITVCSVAEVVLSNPAVGHSLQIRTLTEKECDADFVEIDDYNVPLAYADENAFAQRHVPMISVIGAMAVIYTVLLLRERKEIRRLQGDLQAKKIQ